jgi:hypothetical protein
MARGRLHFKVTSATKLTDTSALIDTEFSKSKTAYNLLKHELHTNNSQVQGLLQRKHCDFTAKKNVFLLFVEIVVVYSENNTCIYSVVKVMSFEMLKQRCKRGNHSL